MRKYFTAAERSAVEKKIYIYTISISICPESIHQEQKMGTEIVRASAQEEAL